MYICGDTIDDVLYKLFPKIINSKYFVEPTKGRNRELTGVLLKIKNPRARLSRTQKREVLNSALGETLWYFSGRNDLKFIENYIPSYRKTLNLSEEEEITNGAYGPRLFGDTEQVKKIIDLLIEKRTTRQAVIQIFDKSDLGQNDVPCTCTIQFLSRSGVLDMFVSMRSNDAYMGLVHDIFAFTFLQEYVARCIGDKLGQYSHFVGSLHIYETEIAKAEEYIASGVQSKIEMPPMTIGDPRDSMKWLLDTENKIRLKSEEEVMLGELSLPDKSEIDPYWQDIALVLFLKRMLKIFNFQAKVVNKREKLRVLAEVKKRLSTDFYEIYVRVKENHEKNLFNSYIARKKIGRL